MSRVPFYADADALAREDAGGREFFIFLFYLGLTIASAMILTNADNATNPIFKFLAALWLIGVPSGITLHMKRKVDQNADELLKAEYNSSAATSGISFMTIALAWILLGRWAQGLHPVFDRVADFVIWLAPYLIIYLVYSDVRKKMIALSKEDV